MAEKSLVDELAEALAEAIRKILPNVGYAVAFLVHAEDMVLLMECLVNLKNIKGKRGLTEKEQQHILDVLFHVWDDAKPFTRKDMDRVLRGLELVEQEDAKKNSRKTEDEELVEAEYDPHWRMEVANGDTKLSLVEWIANKREEEASESEDVEKAVAKEVATRANKTNKKENDA